ncbi:hypothetical protein CHLNCDRAFT_135566 [Chlorella variabilis]|uniref:R3H domain-containing protein n=1 Tax=Chlorella variabilis TaxID=554065 RepID=E1ZIG9_CHLVA|nr:hypothetical protein CHLNCDRAFT_135566 [Chlorella variabilis]EFN54330.1 hypothetical protein CHLNCDRAFT_135566 [Chlorella variabilis]|eukprot:XP_005846432.1 hypothetical protein CHLNCDRAFT_135566 [Chlorella variabilis]
MRQAAQRYIPPSRRREGGAADAADTEPRGLEGAGPELSQVRLVVLRQGTTAALDTSSCPLDIEAQEGDPPAAWIIYVPEREPERLLRWFASVLGGGAARLEFPASLSKRERAWWHGIANRHRLHTESVGVGDGRYLTVSTAAPGGGEEGGEAPEGGAARGAARLTREQQQRANAIYDACQMEGGKYWERSRGEVEALVASGQPLPADLEALADKRLRGQRVNELLRGGSPTEALELLSVDPKLAWVKDSQTGGYPVHIAAWKGYESVALFLASLPGVLEQRDGRRETALAVARRRRHAAIEELLLEAGANPEHASFQEAAPSSSGGAAEEGEYMSWSAEERQRYRHGGEGGEAPPSRCPW